MQNRTRYSNNSMFHGNITEKKLYKTHKVDYMFHDYR